MTTHELAHLLLAGDDVPVLIDGYEGGLCDVAEERIFRGVVSFDVRDPTYRGPHGGTCGRFDDADDGGNDDRRVAVVISRSGPE